jgi:hypothetical protein
VEGQLDRLTVEEHLARAAKAGAHENSSVTATGALYELLLKKAMEAVQCMLQDMDNESGVQKNNDTSLTLVGPLVEALERLRVLHITSRAWSGRRKSPHASGPSAVVRSNTHEAGVQTDFQKDDAAMEIPPTSSSSSVSAKSRLNLVDKGTTLKAAQTVAECVAVKPNTGKSASSMRKTCGVQVCRDDFSTDVIVQANMPAPSAVSCDVGSQTSCSEDLHVELKHVGVQALLPVSASKSSSSQTENYAESAGSSAVRTVRITRMQRLSSQSQPMLQTSSSMHEPSQESADAMGMLVGASGGAKHDREATDVEPRQGRSRNETPKQANGHRSRSASAANCAVRRMPKSVSGATPVDSPLPLLRCPGGHGLQ